MPTAPLSFSKLAFASFTYFRRTHAATAMALAILTAVMTGALLVGDSVRQSLYDAAVSRLGPFDLALTPERYFQESLVTSLAKDSSESPFASAVPLIRADGGIAHAASNARASRIQILGIADSFFSPESDAKSDLVGRMVMLNEALAREINAKKGDDVILHLRKPGDVAEETLLGRRDESSVSLRLTVARIIAPNGLGSFSLNPANLQPRNAFVPLGTLQKALDQAGRVNTILVSSNEQMAQTPKHALHRATEVSKRAVRADLQTHLDAGLSLADLGLNLPPTSDGREVSIESTSFLINPLLQTAAKQSLEEIGAPYAEILAYIANTISVERPEEDSLAPSKGRDIPYSVVAAFARQQPPRDAVLSRAALDLSPPQPGHVLINRWTANELAANIGDSICLEYFITESLGQLATRRSCFLLSGIVETPTAAGSSWTPEYYGITDVRSLADWNPPFPIDTRRIRRADDEYWDRFRTAPKVFLSLEDGRRLWAEQAERFGSLTSIRFAAAPGKTIDETTQALREAVRKQIDWTKFGFTFQPVREQLAAASRGSTDFAMLFASFSFFLIVAAAILSILLFRLMIERRAGEIGLLLAAGYSSRRVTVLLLAEGAIIAAVGGLLGLIGSLLYSWAMLSGLRTWWSQALQAPLLSLHVKSMSLVIGFVLGFVASLVSIAWAVRGISKWQPRALLAGALRAEPIGVEVKKSRKRFGLAGASLVGAATLILLSLIIYRFPAVAAFFGGGALLLMALLLFASATLRGEKVNTRTLEGERPIPFSRWVRAIFAAIRAAAS